MYSFTKPNHKNRHVISTVWAILLNGARPAPVIFDTPQGIPMSSLKLRQFPTLLVQQYFFVRGQFFCRNLESDAS